MIMVVLLGRLTSGVGELSVRGVGVPLCTPSLLSHSSPAVFGHHPVFLAQAPDCAQGYRFFNARMTPYETHAATR